MSFHRTHRRQFLREAIVRKWLVGLLLVALSVPGLAAPGPGARFPSADRGFYGREALDICQILADLRLEINHFR